MDIEISDRKSIEESLREQTEIIETINRVGQTLSAELDLKKLVQALTDAATELTGARFGSFFYNVLDSRGASYMLYTLSGVPIEHFVHFPMPRATDMFGPTFRGEGVIRIRDVTARPPLRQELSLLRHPARPPARHQLPGGPRHLAFGRSVGRAFLRPPRSGRLYRTSRKHSRRARGSGRDSNR